MGTKKCMRATKKGPTLSNPPFHAAYCISIIQSHLFNHLIFFYAQGAALAGRGDGAVHRHVRPFTPSQSHESLFTAARTVIQFPRRCCRSKDPELARICVTRQMQYANRSPAVSNRIDKPKALSLLLHTADISHPSKPWPLHSRWTKALMEEFFQQVGNLACEHLCFQDKWIYLCFLSQCLGVMVVNTVLIKQHSNTALK